MVEISLNVVFKSRLGNHYRIRIFYFDAFATPTLFNYLIANVSFEGSHRS